VWVPLADPGARYPWSLLWRADEQAAPLAAVRECARLTAAALGWLDKHHLANTMDARRAGDHIS
jgi:hypothetical protein